LSHGFGENIIFNSFLESGGVVSADEAGNIANIIENPGIYYGTNLQYPYEVDNIGTNNNYLWGSGNENLLSTVMVTNHADILEGSLQPYVAPYAGTAQSGGVTTTTGGGVNVAGYNLATGGGVTTTTPVVTTVTGNNDAVTYSAPEYGNGAGGQGTASATLQDDGNIYYPEDFSAPNGSYYNSNSLFGPSAISNSDANIDSNIKRRFNSAYITESNEPNNTSTTYPNATGLQQTWNNFITNTGAQDPHANNRILQNHSTGGILFNRLTQASDGYANNWVEFRDLGANNGMGNFSYDNAPGTPGNGGHAAMYAGDEIEIRVEIKVWSTNGNAYQPGSAWETKRPYNIIEPFIQITDGTAAISSSNLMLGLGLSNPQLQGLQGPSPGNSQSAWPGSTTNNNFFWQNIEYGSSSYDSSGSYGGISYSTDKFCSGGSTNDPQYKFPTTTTSISGASQGSPATETYTLLLRYKFKSTNQTYSTTTNFYDEKIVSDLRVRVGNYKKNSTNNGASYYAGNLAKQKWEVSNVKVRKLLGIVSPDTEAVAETFTTTTTGGVTTTTPITYTWVPTTYYPIVTTTTDIIPGTDPIAEVLAVPPSDVDAWTQVRHDGINGWTEDGDGAGSSWPQVQTNSGFGNNYNAVAQTGYAQNFVDTTGNSGVGAVINYVIPDPSPSNFNSPFTAANPYPNAAADGDGTSNSGLLISDYQNTYIRIQTNANENVGFYDSITADPWVDGQWYLVDVEYDAGAYPNAGDGTANNGFAVIDGVADLGGTIGADIDSDGVGYYAGDGTKMSVALVPTVRTEYGNTDGSGDNKSVLRGVFQFSANSYRAEFNYAYRKNTFRINFWDFVNFMTIQKIISRKLDVVTTTGEADSWYHKSETQNHSLSPQTMYWSSDGTGNKANTLCLEDVAAPGYGYWAQDFLAGNGPLTSAEGWKLKFTVTKNPRTNTFEGGLRMYLNSELDITNDPLDTTPMSFGIHVEGITAEGDYEVDFNFEASDSGWVVTEPGGASNTTISVYPHDESDAVDNKVVFLGADGVKTICGIKDIVLGDKTLILLGGTVGSWSWQGFDDSTNNFITWEDTVDQVTGIQENRILFTNCPVIDPNSTLSQDVQITASQYIDTPVNRYEHYTISVDHGINTGDLAMYYYNGEGFGFRILNLNSSNQGTVATDVVIGDFNWSSINHVNPAYAPEMKETFVIRPHGNSADVNGWIDNITMTRSFVTEQDEFGQPVFEAKTVSFSEKVNGWTSFKSFVPESGVSLSSKYFTFKQGGLYEHYAPMSYDSNATDWVQSTSDLAENYNRFYGITTYKSSLKAILNEEPSAVKTFDTINYEGSQSYVKLPTSVEHVTINNAQAWRDSADVKGWRCVDVKTDLEAGSIREFINKEGKWFGYIKGDALNAKLDTSRFSVQGLGKAALVVSTPITI
jgi:hypothetical protein